MVEIGKQEMDCFGDIVRGIGEGLRVGERAVYMRPR
jgi:hypothetical protein